jgi:hypothetical protein
LERAVEPTFFGQNDVQAVLRGFNPWWSGKAMVVPEFRRLALGICMRVLGDTSLRRGVLLSGPRRVGKTTILNQIADVLVREDGRDPRSVLYVSLDHPLLKLLSLFDVLRLYHETTWPEGSPAVLLLDEVQYSEDWELHVKQVLDHSPEYRVIATGSASVLSTQRLADSGVGRWVRVPIPTLSFYEFVHIRREEAGSIPADVRPMDLSAKEPEELSGLAAAFRRLLPLFKTYLLVGGFPETANRDDVEFSQRLQREDVVERVLKRDMTALFGIRNVNDLEKLFIYLCLNSGGVLSVRTCAGALGVSETAVANHLAALESANLIYRVPPVRKGGKKVLKMRHKVYLVDAALRNAVLLRGEEALSDPREMGVMVETTVLRHLYAYYYQDTPEIGYWNDPRRNKEVDFVIRSPRYVIPVEVKYRADSDIAPTDGMVELCRDEPVGSAYWVTQREEDFDVQRFPGVSAPILRVPAHIFTYLLGQAERLLWTE